MTEVSFHFNVPDRLGYACRLLRKAVRRGARVAVAAPDALLAQFDRQLWVFEPLDFIPHLHAKPGQAVAPRLQDTPVWLVSQPADAFQRVIELVSADGEDRLAGRARWKQYAERGFKVSGHDVAKDAA